MVSFHRPPPAEHIPTHFMTDDEILSEVGEKVRQRRLTQNITHEDLARHAGVSRSSVHKIENGQSVAMSVFIKVMRSLFLLDSFRHFIPADEHDYEKIRNNTPDRQRARKKS